MLILLPLLGVLFNGLTTAHVEANLSLEFRATKVSKQANLFHFRMKFVPQKVNYLKKYGESAERTRGCVCVSDVYYDLISYKVSFYKNKFTNLLFFFRFIRCFHLVLSEFLTQLLRQHNPGKPQIIKQ